MKNLSAIPRLSLFAAYTILITLVVDLAGFTGAEAHLNYNQEGQEFRGKEDGFYRRQSQGDVSNPGMYSQKSSVVRDDELSQQRNFASYLNGIARDVPLGMIMKRHSQDFDESDEFDSERENDGYGYDDDEYYHLNYKRNDDGSQKGEKEGVGEVGDKEKLNSETFAANKAQNENQPKESKTIEMLNFKEIHPNSDPNHSDVQNAKPYAYQGQKKSLTPEPMDALKMSDLKENSALDEKIKGGKEEAGGVLSSQSDVKVAEVKKGTKVMEEKESVNLKDPKIVEESEKKEKELAVQDKSSLSANSLKENAKSTEEKEKIEHDVKSVKLSESAKIIEGMDKISKSKEGETAKITKEDKDNSRFYDRLNSEIISSNDFSQLNNRVNLVSSDYKDNLEQLKRSGMEEDEKNSEEFSENDRNVNLNDYSDELRERKNILKESEYGNNYGLFSNGDDSYSEIFRDLKKNNKLFGIPVAYQIRNDPSEFYDKRELWKDHTKQSSQDPNHQLSYMSGSNKDGYRLNIPKSELDNTEYHKNFVKSLRRYKTSEDQKNINGASSDKNPHTDKLPEPYQKLSKTKRGSLNYGEFDVEDIKRDKCGNDQFKVRRHAYTNGDVYTRGQQNQNQPYDMRQRRKTQKFEYDTKTFNQGPSTGKGLNSIKRKKEIKKKFGDQNEGNAVRQYPYSQVSREYLSKLNQFNNDKKFKRKAPLWKRRERSEDDSRDSDTTARNKGAPIGYYTNRVKFGQKVVNRNDEERGGTETTKLNGMSQFSSSYEKARNPVEKSWMDSKSQRKRYDEKEHSSNPLLLVKKDKNGERLAKAFTDVNAKSEGDEELSSDQLAKILSKDSDYVILKKKDKNKYQKLNENQGSLDQTGSLMGLNFHKNTLHADSVKSDKSKLASKHESGPHADRGLYIRSYHADEDNKKYNSNKLHSSGTKSNLRKTFEKFRDLANLFRDNEQESSDNQRQSSEAKVGGEIVFSEDRMPDPIVISNDANNKLGGFKSKSSNSISNISNNFKTLDQNKKSDTAKEDDSGKNMFTSEMKTDNTESSWEPALKTAFPEAKSINSIQKNGNEIIVLDFNQNQLKTDTSKMFSLGKQSQPIGPPVPSNTAGSLTMGGLSGPSDSYGNMDAATLFMPGGSPGMYQQRNPLVSQGDRQVEVILHEGVLPTFLQGDTTANKQGEVNKAPGGNQPATKFAINGQNGAYAILTGTPNEAQIAIPIYPFNTNGKNTMDKKPNPLYTNLKSMTKKNSDYLQQNDIANNVNQLMKDFKELSKLYQTHDSRGALGHVYSNGGVLSSNSFSEPLPNSNNKQKFLHNLLQNIMSGDKTGDGTPNTKTYQNDNVEFDNNAYQRSDLWSKNNVAYETDPTSKRQGKWTSAVGRKSDYTPYQSNKLNYVPEEVRQDMSKLLQSEGFKTTDKDKYQDSLWEELSEASDKIQRLRREGADTGKLKKTIEDALSYRERRQSEKKLTSDTKTGDNNKKLESNVNTDESKNKMICDKAAASFKDDKNTNGKSNVQEEPQVKEGDNKGNHESKRSVTKSDLEGHLTDLSPKDQLVNSNYSETKRRERRHVERRKRSLNAKNKVSTADIQNEILKNLAEDNYQSVYSSGIRRKLLSIQDDEDADNYINPNGNDEELVTGDTRLHSVNDPINRGIDPTILTLFDANNGEKEKSRARRSLSTAFHSNYKREIDLDESMPNDFQNFLVTSLGGFGSQKREVIKRDEALWEGKESSQDNFNQIVDSSQGGKDSSEDSALEKRDVSKSEKHRHESFRDNNNNNYFSDESGKEISRLKSGESHTRKKARSQDSSKASEYEEDKNPTRIRIQVTNASSKEKKSSKPIMDESENTSTEMENLPKEKEFLDKNKVRVNKAQKMYSLRDPKFTSSNSVHLEGKNPSNQNNQKVYYDTHPNHRRKKKKYIEENPMKPIKSFMAFDQKAMESLLKKYFADQSSYSVTTQKIPVGSHLPQVETVYNPAQGANKAQLDKYRVSSLKGNGKTNANSKNSLRSNVPDSYDSDAWRSYLQEKPGKSSSEKENVKPYVDGDWKVLTGRVGLSSDQDIHADIRLPKLQTFGRDFASPSTQTVGGYPSQTLNRNDHMIWNQKGLNYMNRKPSDISSNALYDALKLKKQLQPYNNHFKDSSMSKMWPKPPSGKENVYNTPDEKTPDSLYNQSPGEMSWNHDYFFNKNPLPQKYKTKDSYGNNFTGLSKQRFLNNILKLKSLNTDKQLRSAPQQFYVFDNGKDLSDYLDALDEDYMESDDPGKQDSQMDAATSGDLLKKFNKMFAFNPRHSKNSEFERAMGDEELDEDYEENNEDDEDYSLIAGSNAMDPDSRQQRGSERLQGSFRLDDSRSFYPKPVSHELRGTGFEHAQYKYPKSEDFLDTNPGYIGLTDVRNDLNPFGGSSSVLRKVNENSNNFGESLMKSLNRYNYDETWKDTQDKDLSRIYGNDFESNSNSKIDKRKINWRTKSKRNPLPEIGSRLFYASKSEVYDTKDLNSRNNQGSQSKTGRSVYYRLPKRNPMNAELRGAENEFEYESEGNGKHFTGNLLNGGKENSDDDDTTKLKNSNRESSNGEEDGGTNKRNSENSENVDDVKENLEDDGETIAEDNILENVIGKYIMRKSVKPGTLSRFDRRDEKKLSEEPIRHNLKKRSLEDVLSDEHFPKVKALRKRLSSGHLTENNFRKYHKKNPNKRNSKELEKNVDTDVTSNDIINEDEAGDVSEENENENEKENSDRKQVTLSSDENEVKRSALDIFKKITNKDKDTKKSDDLNIRTAGFEPILSSSERGVQSVSKEGNKDGYVMSSKKSIDMNSKLHSESKGMSANNKKAEKLNDITHQTSLSADGPWRIELKEKDNSKLNLVPGKNSEKKFKNTMLMKERLVPIKSKQDLKTYIVLSNNIKAAKRNSESEEATTLNLENPQREIDSNFRATAKEGARPSARDIWKRSLKSSLDQVQDTAQGALKNEATDISTTATRALHDTSNLSEDDLKARTPQNSKNSDSVNIEAQFRHSDEKRKFFSNNGSSTGKSILPIPNDANIIGDNMHLNEETSKYLGQQIVDAILAQATTDPRFKKFIAPGLSVKASHIRRRTEDDGKFLHHKDFSDQVQTLMQSVMSDLEKLAEKHVKKRMCNQIDNQSKQFLHFLLDVPIEKITQTRQTKDKTRSVPYMFMQEGSVPDQDLSNMVQVSIQENMANFANRELKKPTQHYQSDQFEMPNKSDKEKSASSKKDAIFLMRKKCLLSQLLKNYQYLKEGDMNEQYAEKVRALVNELETTNKELGTMDSSMCKCQKKKKPPKCPSSCSFPTSPPCPGSSFPPPPPPPNPCPPPPPPSSCLANKDLGNGSQWLDVEQTKPPANESQEEPQEGTSETTTKQPADIFQFEPLVPLNISDQNPFLRPKFSCRSGFEIVTPQNTKNDQTTPPDPYKTPIDIPLEFGKVNTIDFDNKQTYTKPFNQGSLDLKTTLPNYPPTELPVTFKYNTSPLSGDSKETKDASGVNLFFMFGEPTVSSFDWAKGNPTNGPGLPDVGSTESQLGTIPSTSTPRQDFEMLSSIRNSQNPLNIYNNAKAPYHNQFWSPEVHPEGSSFRRNFYDKNVIPTDKDSASQKIRRGQNISQKNRRLARNTKNKWLSLKNFRQDQNMGEEKRRVRELRGWWRPKSQKQSQRTYLTQNRIEDDEEEDPGMEYLVWSSMPAVRRRLNNMEPVIDLEKISWPGLRRRNLPEEEEEERRQPGSV